MKKLIMMIIMILFSILSYSQNNVGRYEVNLDKKLTFTEFYRITQIEQPQVNKYLLVPRPKRKEPNDLIIPATVGYFAFASILTLNHFSEECNYKGENNNNKAYIALLGGLTVTYIIVISIN